MISNIWLFADGLNRQRQVSRRTDENGETWSLSGMSKVRSRPESPVADCSMPTLQPPERRSRQESKGISHIGLWSIIMTQIWTQVRNQDYFIGGGLQHEKFGWPATSTMSCQSCSCFGKFIVNIGNEMCVVCSTMCSKMRVYDIFHVSQIKLVTVLWSTITTAEMQ